jgi:cbb3-type cytochrome oxidase subunit 1
MLVGRDHRRPADLAGAQLRHPWLSYGRLRPLHTNAVIFAFGGCALFATSYHVVQRTCQTRLFAPGLAMFTFWGWHLVIVLARSRCRWASPAARNTPNSSGRSTS